MVTTVVVLLLAVALPAAVLTARWAWSCQRRRLGVWWGETLRPVVLPPRTLDVPALQRRIFLTCLRAVTVSGRGAAVLPLDGLLDDAPLDPSELLPHAG